MFLLICGLIAGKPGAQSIERGFSGYAFNLLGGKATGSWSGADSAMPSVSRLPLYLLVPALQQPRASERFFFSVIKDFMVKEAEM